MLKKRLIAVLILNEQNVVQSVRFKHTNAIHYDAVHAIDCFNKWSVDEIAILNVSRDPDSKKQFSETIKNICKKCFVPVSAGGWVNETEYARELFYNGADKIILNTAFFENPEFCSNLAKRFGTQSLIASMDVKQDDTQTSVWINRGSKNIRMAPIDWAKKLVSLGAGEIFFNSIDHDGARRGYNLEVLNSVCTSVNIPVIAFGGVFTWTHLLEGFKAGADAVALANQLHYTEHSAKKAKNFLLNSGISMRN